MLTFAEIIEKTTYSLFSPLEKSWRNYLLDKQSKENISENVAYLQMLAGGILLTEHLLLMKERVDWPPTLLLSPKPQLYQLYLLLIRLRVKLHELVPTIHVPPHPFFLYLHRAKASQSLLKHHVPLSSMHFALHLNSALKAGLAWDQRQLLNFLVSAVL